MTIHTDAMKIEELAYTLGNISQDDKKPIKAYTIDEVVAEAKYVLDLFINPSQGHTNHDLLIGEEGPNQQKWASGQVRQLRSFIKKYA